MIRRIVTVNDKDGASTFLSDGPSPWCASFKSIPGFEVNMLWATDGRESHADADFPDRGEDPRSWIPGPSGSLVVVVTFPPDSVMMSDQFDGMAAHQEQMEKLPGLAERFEAENPGMHRTPTLDYGVVLSGKIRLELDDGQTKDLQAHDVVVQRGTRHAWRNPGSHPATVLFVMLGSREPS
ncbi:cupin domain-containing protein [Paraburkholderia sp. BL25I1N1]|uniref:cupin domain-containing protein n=1 Tax=Paraburkholderia sp. BL25I1N1 TaxID=1938804 RepID=UPI000D4A2F1A|nr:cupin domain-containing protein [Paraburkholderia sp. BL25I1N1]PRY05970.1 Cupin domain-containing protein [Paraburkholderia sp. BL25I1N1]